MSLGLLLLIVLIVILFAGLPNWGYHSYGYAPSGILMVVVVILVVLFLMGRF